MLTEYATATISKPGATEDGPQDPMLRAIMRDAHNQAERAWIHLEEEPSGLSYASYRYVDYQSPSIVYAPVIESQEPPKDKGFDLEERINSMLKIVGVFWQVGGFESLISIHEIPLGGGVLRRCEPIMLDPSRSPCGEYFTVAVKDLEMDITESSIEGLKDAVEAVLGMKWKRYAEGDPARMTLGAQRLRKRLRAMYSYEPGT